MGIRYNGSAYMQTSTMPVVNVPLTIALWYNPSNVATTQGIAGIFDSSSSSQWSMINQRSTGEVSAYSRGSANVQGNGPTNPTVGVWCHVAAVFASTSSRICYVNGSAGTEETSACTVNDADVWGAGRYLDLTPGSALVGNALTAEMAIWDVALTAAEVAELAEGVPPHMIRPASLKAYYPQENAAEGGLDLLQGGYDLTITNTVNDDIHPPMISIEQVKVIGTATPVASDTVTQTEIDDYRVLARAADGNGDITVSGTYTGTPTTIQYRLVDHGTTTPVTGHDWQTLDAAPAGGTYSGTIANIPAGGWYNIDVRFSNDTAVTDDGTSRWGVGVLVGVIGQSEARNLFEVGSTYTSTETVSQYTGKSSLGETLDVWAAPVSNGVRKMGDVVVATMAIPAGFFKHAVGSSALNTDSDSGSGYWLNTAASSIYDAFQADVNAQGGTLDAVVWYQGPTEALNGDCTAGRYKTDLATLRTNIAGDISPANGASSIPIVIVQTARDTRTATTKGSNLEYSEVRRGQRVFAEDTADGYFVTTIDVALSDGVHPTAAANTTIGERIAHALLQAFGETATYPAPTCASWAIVSATTTDVTITHGEGTDYTPISSITGFEVEIDDSWVSATGAQQSTTVIRLTHASGTVTGCRYMFGAAPTITGVVVDNTALALPLVPNENITATASGGGGGMRLAGRGGLAA